MRKFIVWKDGHKRELTPISFKEFMVIDLWYSSSTDDYTQWLYKNNFSEADSFNDDALDEGKFVITNEPLNFDELLFCIDGENWKPYKELKDSPRTYGFKQDDRTLRYFKEDYVEPEDR